MTIQIQGAEGEKDNRAERGYDSDPKGLALPAKPHTKQATPQCFRVGGGYPLVGPSNDVYEPFVRSYWNTNQSYR